MRAIKKSFYLFFFIFIFTTIFAGTEDSGGPILPEQAAYDVLFYDINLKIDPSIKSISGYVSVEVHILQDVSKFVLHLFDNYTVTEVTNLYKDNSSVNFSHKNGLLEIDLNAQANELIKVKIVYSGKPPAPGGLPWSDGFEWRDGTWIGMACEGEGADVWIPCKDHPSDEPDSVAINLTVPSNLTCVANGQNRGTTDVDANWKTFHWFVTNPINNYNLTFYIANFEYLKFDYTSTSGDYMPMEFWVLPQYKTLLQNHSKNLLKYIRAMEELCGPFPFRKDKFAYVHSNYWGMEHQSAIAYGHNFKTDSFGLDYIAVHELAHEWWGNLVTAKNWRDCWIHEGFGTYMEALVAEKLNGYKSYHSYMKKVYTADSQKPVVPEDDVTAGEIFNGSHGVYYKGATVLHNLRFLLGDEKLFQFIRTCAYPDPQLEKITDGSQCRLATTDEIIEIANNIAGKDITWYFEAVLRSAKTPELEITNFGNKIELKWITGSKLQYDMPVEVSINGEIKIIEFTNSSATINLSSSNDEVIYDPNNWLLKESTFIVGVEDLETSAVDDVSINTYPNPFNAEIKIVLDLPETTNCSIDIFDISGSQIEKLTSKKLNDGRHYFYWNAVNFSSGHYFVRYSDGKNLISKKIMLIK